MIANIGASVPKKQPIFPEDVLVATFYKVGHKVRIPNDQHLAEIFNDAAESFGDLFRPFKWNRLYRHSTVLSDALQHIDLGGAIVRENAPTPDLYFTIAARTAGDYGKQKFDRLTPKQRTAVEQVARRISERFTVSPAAVQTNR
jgi:hypothetical protein